jgi:hypothetical protein
LLKETIRYELHAVTFKEVVSGYLKHKVNQEDIDKVKAAGEKVLNAGH